jgi:hypothetical protein
MASARPFQRAKRTGGCHLLPSIGADRQGAKPPLALCKIWREKRAEKLSFFVFWWGEK